MPRHAIPRLSPEAASGAPRPVVAALAVATGGLWTACKGAERPRVTPAAARTIAATADGAALRGVASRGPVVYATFATASGSGSSLRAWRDGATTLAIELPGTPGEIAAAGEQIAVAISGAGPLRLPGGAQLALRGDPSAVLLGFQHATGAPRWRLALDSTQWASVSGLATLGDDVVVGGSFGGTLRAGDRVITSAGGSDGFVARVTAAGAVTWLVRIGGAGADGVAGIDATPQRVAIAGTFTAGADLLGQPLAAYDERSPFGDAFVAELDPSGARRWVASFGGRADDVVAGVAIAGERVAVAASVRDVVSVGSASVVTSGPSDGLVVWYGEDGELGASALLGGLDFDGLRAITAVGDRAVVGGFFSGRITLGGRALEAGGGDDAFLAAIDPGGAVVASWHVGGAGREEIADLAVAPGGFVAGVAHTAGLNVDGEAVATPAPPATGAALLVRGL